MEKLIELGFENIGYTSAVNGKLDIIINSKEFAKNILYAFVRVVGDDIIDWQVVYIGHTRNSLKNRMAGYRLGNGKATNNRVHNHLKNILDNDGNHRIYVLHDKINLNIHSIEVDLAAGLEYALIQYYANYNSLQGHPNLFNIAGNLNNPENENIEVVISQIQEENSIYPEFVDQGFELKKFVYKLGTTYWEKPYVNIPVEFGNLFGLDGDVVAVDFIQEGHFLYQVQVKINRTATNNGAPRLYFPMRNGTNYFQNWKHTNFSEGDAVIVKIIERNHLLFEI
jgi:hypothetical protein